MEVPWMFLISIDKFLNLNTAPFKVLGKKEPAQVHVDGLMFSDNEAPPRSLNIKRQTSRKLGLLWLPEVALYYGMMGKFTHSWKVQKVGIDPY